MYSFKFVAAAIVLATLVWPSPIAAQVSAPDAAKFARWFELQNLTLNLRHRVIDNTSGTVTTNSVQHRETVRARVKFDKAARYTVN
jgi:hypothetical protein